jgi:hypothetical protein
MASSSWCSLSRRRLGEFDRVRRSLGIEPLRIGTAVAAEGLSIGDTPIDGAKIRNLFDDAGGDPRVYLNALLRMSTPQ